MSYNLVWFKRDLRVHDHAPLVHASRNAPVRCLFIIEPSLWAADDTATQHYQFLRESLLDLDIAWRKKCATDWNAVKYCSERCRHQRFAAAAP
ncbi:MULTISPECIES: DUF2256 domain-containing protein [Methylomonas]|uniref:Photolyase/cryptochrome alpha/beta domain-containing protein n=2 Tax=Methylomonas TaxID=416 RepID=A0A126T2W7_9GAMM|nr:MULTISPECIES: DUF2256 domain-containing protein [Methylomonas]AMK76415.1 hypothetical protein JT25_007905 [Methylomonas denitrificans]OAH98674.1 hypothetical protein A1342_12645 [Methylomonas methanica]TCV88446.1 uncharacterized protein DUF2256 [Methylomonas methanica]